MATINIPTVELVSTLRAAPVNGPTNSQDYNDSWTESLADLASLSGFINDTLLPMLNGLISTIQPVQVATPHGIEGRYIFSDTSDLTPVFFDGLTNQSLSVSDSLRILNGIISAVQTTVANLNVEVTALQTQLAATNQNDIAQALQNFAASLSNLSVQTVNNTQTIINNTIALKTNGVNNPVQNQLNLVAGANITLTPSGGTVTIAATGGGGGGTPGGVTTNIQVNSSGTFYGDNTFTWDHVTGSLFALGTAVGAVVLAVGTSQLDYINIDGGTAILSAREPGATASVVADNGVAIATNTGSISIGGPGGVTGITLRGFSSGLCVIGPASVAGTPNRINLPTTTGTSGQVLTTDGANPQQTSWTNAGAVSSVFTRVGAVVAVSGDYTVAQVTGAAPLASPTFTGTPAAPTAAVGTNTTQIATTAFVAAANKRSIQFVIDGGGSVPTTGAWGQISIPFACTITAWTITADASGSAVIDVLRSTYAGFPTTSSIAGTDKPTLSSAQKNTDSTLTGWGSTAIAIGDELQLNLNSVTTCKRLNLTITVTVP